MMPEGLFVYGSLVFPEFYSGGGERDLRVATL